MGTWTRGITRNLNLMIVLNYSRKDSETCEKYPLQIKQSDFMFVFRGIV